MNYFGAMCLGAVFGYLNEKIKKSQNKILIPSPPSDSYRLNELNKIQYQYFNRFAPDYLQEQLDKDSAKIFNLILLKNGLGDHLQQLKEWEKQIVKSIMFHKLYFNQLRPHQLAQYHNIPFAYDMLFRKMNYILLSHTFLK